MDINELRRYRIAEIALFDVIGTFIGAYITKQYFEIDISLTILFILFIILGIIVHKVIGTDTQLNYYLGISDKPKRDTPSINLLLTDIP